MCFLERLQPTGTDLKAYNCVSVTLTVQDSLLDLENTSRSYADKLIVNPPPPSPIDYNHSVRRSPSQWVMLNMSRGKHTY